MRDTVTLKLSSVNQITIPSSFRKTLGVEAGDELEAEVVNGALTVRKAMTHEEKVKKVFADLERMRKEHEKRMTPEQKKIAEMTKGWTVNQYHEYFDNTPEHKAYIKEKYGI